MIVYPSAIVLGLLVPLATGEDVAARAKRLFDAGDYPAAERAMVELLDSLPAAASRERALALARLAEVRVLEGQLESAVTDADKALGLLDAPEVRRSAMFVALRAQRFADVVRHAGKVLEAAPGDASARFSRGIARARLGEFETAVPDLEAGLGLEGAARDARLELALAFSKLGRPAQALTRLREILEIDPYDAEACYQASRQVLKLRRPGSAALSATLVRYFETLREAEGQSSREEHLGFAGKAADAAMVRAARWERMGRYDRALDEAKSAIAAHPESDALRAWLAAFYVRLGVDPLLDEAGLERALAMAQSSGDDVQANRIARCLLARAPRNATALRQLAKSVEDVSLIVPRLHFVRRLAEADAGDPRWAAELAMLRAAFEGASPRR